MKTWSGKIYFVLISVIANEFNTMSELMAYDKYSNTTTDDNLRIHSIYYRVSITHNYFNNLIHSLINCLRQWTKIASTKNVECSVK